VAAPLLTWDAYAVAWARLHDGFDLRHASPAVRGWLRAAYGIGRVLARVRVSPVAVMVFALLLNLAVPVTAAFVGPWPAATLILVAAMADTVNGAVALLRARTSRLGSLYDSLVQRVAEVSWLTALWVVGATAWLLVVCGAVSWLHEYIRARASAMGMTGASLLTVGEQPTRLSATAAGLVLAGVADQLSAGLAAGTVTVAAVVWAFLGLFGLSELLSSVRRSLR
jgi:CDP-diacylglycerol--glycerol-3-phosphate 3-phosphatidyltransferase